MALYIWTSMARWTGRQDWRSWVAGVHVSQERALYCSSTNLWVENIHSFIEALGENCWRGKNVTAAFSMRSPQFWTHSSHWQKYANICIIIKVIIMNFSRTIRRRLHIFRLYAASFIWIVGANMKHIHLARLSISLAFNAHNEVTWARQKWSLNPRGVGPS